MPQAILNQQSTRTYNLDPAHTTLEFVVRHLMITKVRGRFSKFEGTITLAPESSVPTSVKAAIEAASIETKEPQRDDHLRSADFLDAEHHPQLTFVSSRIEGDERSFKIFGTLTIRGTSRPVAFDASFEGRVNDPWGNERIGYAAHTTINRKDFGLTWNQALETGGVVVGDEVRIELNVEAIAQP
jgi:polyisoprenoid-binding protein YceI